MGDTAERGATAHKLMAIFGWRTIKQAEAYTRAADRKRLAGDAMHLLGTNSGETSLTSGVQTPRGILRRKSEDNQWPL